MSYTIRISLKIEHPRLHPDVISKVLRLAPKWSRAAGEIRKTPKGQLLEGINKETYWLHEFNVSEETDVESSLATVVRMLQRRKMAFHKLSRSGATHALSIGMFLEKDAGFDLNHDLLNYLVKIDVSISFSIYTPEAPRAAE